MAPCGNRRGTPPTVVVRSTSTGRWGTRCRKFDENDHVRPGRSTRWPGKKADSALRLGQHRNVKFLTEESKRVWPRRAYQLLFFVGPQGPECRGGMSEAGSKNQRVWVSCTRDVGCAGKGWPPEFPRCRLGQPSPVCFAGAGATNVETGDRSRRLDASRHAYMRMLRVVK